MHPLPVEGLPKLLQERAVNDERPLAEGWSRGWIEARHHGPTGLEEDGSALSLPIITQDLGSEVGGDCADNRWFPANDAPPECFADPAPAPDEALKVEDYASTEVWVDCPACRWHPATPPPVGRGRIHRFVAGGLVDVKMAEGRTVFVPRAAIHREGPAGNPPAEGVVFLGRYDVPGEGMQDFWWQADGNKIQRSGDPCDQFETQKEIDDPLISYPARPAYTPALAVARELGLVEAEAEPKRPEPTFVVGQWWDDGDEDLLVGVIVGDPGWSGDYGEWEYPVRSVLPVAGTSFNALEHDMKPHTMTIADVPDETLLAIMRGEPVRVVDVPVHETGIPYDLVNDPDSTTAECAGELVSPCRIGLDEQVWIEIQETGGVVQVWNLLPATDA